jgi:hypothetical protein
MVGILNDVGTSQTIYRLGGGKFDVGTTAPTGSTRLNYFGNFYATAFYGNIANGTGTPDFVRAAYVVTTPYPNTTSNTVWTNALSVSVTSGKEYKLFATGAYRTAATTTGIKIRIGASSGTYTNLNSQINYTLAQTNAQTNGALHVNGAISDGSVFASGTSVASTSADHGFEITGAFTAQATSTIYLQIQSEVSGSSVEIRPGTILLVQEVIQ